MGEPRIIKKYPNRRLYDMTESRYVTLADVRRLVLEQVDFTVLEHENDADITCRVLLQVIVEKEHRSGQVSLSRTLLNRLIRSVPD